MKAQPLFERSSPINLIPILPAKGEKYFCDGERYFNTEQAAKFAGRHPAEMHEAYRSFLSIMLLSVKADAPEWTRGLDELPFEIALYEYGYKSDAAHHALIDEARARFPLLAANNPEAFRRKIIMELEAKWVHFFSSTFHCNCGRRYMWKVPHAVVRHLVRKHGIEPEEAQRLVAEARASAPTFDEKMYGLKAANNFARLTVAR